MKNNKPPGTVYILTTVFDRFETLGKYYANLSKQSYSNYKLVLIDHGRKDIPSDMIPPNAYYIKSTPEKWWTGAVNVGIEYLKKNVRVNANDFILLQNDDVTFGENLISDLVDISQRKNAVVGAITVDKNSKKILDADNKFNILKAKHVCSLRGENIDSIKEDLIQSDVLKGRGVIYPLNVVNKIGMLDERLNRRSDPEWAYRAKKYGFKIFISTRTIVYTNINTDVTFNGKIDLNIVFDYLFSPRSTANLPDAIQYFFICLGPYLGLYCSIVHSLRTVIYSLYKLARG